MAKLILGCGYLGKRVGDAWKNAGHTVFAVTRSTQKAEQLQRAGLVPIIANVASSESLPPFPEVDTVLFSVGFDRTDGQTIEQVYVGGLSKVVDHLAGHNGQFVYVSSTGVYGQTAGNWVDENSPCQPATAGGEACWAAEQLLQSSHLASQLFVLRLAGIYGPERVPRREAILRGDPIPAIPDGYLNLIHVDDAVQVVTRLESLPGPATYNVSDGRPISRREYFDSIARMLDAPTVRFEPPGLDSGRARRAASNKRVSNQRLSEDLAPLRLKYPSYEQGLKAIFNLPSG